MARAVIFYVKFIPHATILERFGYMGYMVVSHIGCGAVMMLNLWIDT